MRIRFGAPCEEAILLSSYVAECRRRHSGFKQLPVSHFSHPPGTRHMGAPALGCPLGLCAGIPVQHDARHLRPVGTFRLGIEQPQIGHEVAPVRSEEHTSELQSLMRISSAVFCLKKKDTPSLTAKHNTTNEQQKQHN